MYKALIEKRMKQNGVKFGSFGSDPDNPQQMMRGRGGFHRGRGRGHFPNMFPPGMMPGPGPFCEDGFGPPPMMPGFCDDFNGPGFGPMGPGPDFCPPGGPGPWRGRGRGWAGPMPMGGPGPMGPMMGDPGLFGPMGGPVMRGRGGGRGRGSLYNCDMPLGFGNFDDPDFAADMDEFEEEQGDGYNPFQMLANASNSNRGGPPTFGRGGRGGPARGWGRGALVTKPKPVPNVAIENNRETQEVEEGVEEDGEIGRAHV